VTPEKEIVWKLEQHDLPGITLAWVTTLEVLPNGHYVIGNCHAGPVNPLVIEIDPQTKEVVWTFDQYDVFGNAVSNTQLLDANGKVLLSSPPRFPFAEHADAVAGSVPPRPFE
jgi:hypothetical protein